MGWTYFHADPSRSRRDIVADELKPWTVDTIEERGSTVYVIATDGSQHAAIVALTDRRGGQFGVKFISEECGPADCAASESFIERLETLRPNATGWAKQWRDRVRAFHADNKRWEGNKCTLILN